MKKENKDGVFYGKIEKNSEVHRPGPEHVRKKLFMFHIHTSHPVNNNLITRYNLISFIEDGTFW